MTWKIHQQFVLRPLLKIGFQEDQIQHALGRLLVNTLTIDRPHKASVMGLFPHYAMLNHSCVHNVLRFNCGRSTVLVACQDIKEGEEVRNNYFLLSRFEDIHSLDIFNNKFVFAF